MATKKQTFDKLWKRMAARGDVPSLQYSAENIIRSLQDEDASVADLASLVLSDLSFSQKVMRLANSVMYRTMGGDVTTVSRAIMVLGVDTVEYLGLGLQLLTQFQGVAGNRKDALNAIRRAMMAAEFTREVTSERGSDLSEEAVVCTLMYQLARLLVILYLEDEWSKIQGRRAADPLLSESAACQQILGLSFEEIAAGAAAHWRMPDEIQRCMHANLPAPDELPQSHEDWLAAVVSVSSSVVAMMDANASDDKIAEFVLQYAEVLALDEENVQGALTQAHASAQAIDADREAQPTSANGPVFDKPQDAGSRLQAAFEEIHAKAPQCPAASVTPWVVESIMKSMNLKTGFMMLLHPESREYVARFGFGPGIRERVTRLSCSAGFVPDIFHLVATKGIPTLWVDVKESGVSHRMPSWYKAEFPETRSVLFVPVRLRGRCVAMLCGSWGETVCSQELSPQEAQTLSALADEISISFERSAAARPY